MVEPAYEKNDQEQLLFSLSLYLKNSTFFFEPKKMAWR